MINKNNKAQFAISKFLIALAAFSVIFGLYFICVSEMAITYDTPEIIDESLNNSFNKFSEDYSDSQSMFQDIQNSSGLGFVGESGTLLKSAWNVVTVVFTAPVRMHQIVVAMGETIGIPSSVTNLGLIFLYFAISILLIFAIVNYFSRGGKPL